MYCLLYDVAYTGLYFCVPLNTIQDKGTEKTMGNLIFSLHAELSPLGFAFPVLAVRLHTAT